MEVVLSICYHIDNMDTLPMIILAVLSLGFATLFSTLSLCLLPLNKSELKSRAKLGNTEAGLVYPLKVRGRELLVVLVLGYTFFAASFVLIIDRLMPGGAFISVLALVISVILLVFITELLPRAYFSRHGLKLSASLAPFLEVLMNILQSPLKPLAKFLSRAQKSQLKTTYTSSEIINILEEQTKLKHDSVESAELAIVLSALKYGDKQIEDVMTPRKKIVALEGQELITTGVLSDLQKSGHNQIPVYTHDLDHVLGIINMYELVAKQRPNLKAEDTADSNVAYVHANQQLDHVLNAFIKTGQHLMVVINENQNTVGIVTIRDILEQIVGKKLVDVFDKFDNPKAVAELKAAERKTARGLITTKEAK